jgi:hypothetical protein
MYIAPLVVLTDAGLRLVLGIITPAHWTNLSHCPALEQCSSNTWTPRLFILPYVVIFQPFATALWSSYRNYRVTGRATLNKIARPTASPMRSVCLPYLAPASRGLDG